MARKYTSSRPEVMTTRSPVYPGGADPCGAVGEVIVTTPAEIEARQAEQRAKAMAAAKLTQAASTGPKDERFNLVPEIRTGINTSYATGCKPIEYVEPNKEVRTGINTQWATGIAPVEWKPTENNE